MESKTPESKSEHPDSNIRVSPSVTISDNTSEVFTVRFSPDSKLLAAGCGDGAIRVFSATDGRLVYVLQAGSSTSLPTTAIRFRPVSSSARTKNVLVAANAAGILQHWHITSGKCISSMQDKDNQIYAVDYNHDGTQLATAGRDTAVRIYDESTKQLVTCMRGGSGSSVVTTPGHSNRVFSLKYHPDDPNVVVSGGWDNTVQVWDIRAERAVRSFFGPHICGDAVDVCGNMILTGSYRGADQLELWDFGSGEKIRTVPWSRGLFGGQPCMLYAAQFSKEGQGRFIGAGGSGTNEAKLFDRGAGDVNVGTITGLTRAVFTLDFAPNSSKLAVGCGDASIRLLDILDSDRK
jgi:WD40 repeat protein